MTTSRPAPLPRSRSEARSLGLVVFDSRRRCIGGHGTERLVSNGNCPGCLSAAADLRKRLHKRLRSEVMDKLRAQARRDVAREDARKVKQAQRAEAAQALAEERARLRAAKEAVALAAMPDHERQAIQARADKEARRVAREAHKAEAQAAVDAEVAARQRASLEARKGAPPPSAVAWVRSSAGGQPSEVADQHRASEDTQGGEDLPPWE